LHLKNILTFKTKHYTFFIYLLTPLILSSFTHLWNPIGFPSGPSNDENIYVRRALHVISGLGPQESELYDHPYFGQLFLAGIFVIIGYPSSLHVFLNDVHSIEMLYLIPRIIMGILAVVDTLLVYVIAEHKYNRKIAFFASMLFAVMPVTWLTRWVLLDNISLPFLLSSILFAVYSNGLKTSNINKYKVNLLPVLLSGVFLGLAIFTKIPAFTMIPLIAFLVYTNSNGRSLKMLGLWFIPVILLPLIWPAYAASVGQFNLWLDGVYVQMSTKSQSLFYSIHYIINNIDPVLPILGAIGLVFAAMKRDLFILLWIVPFLIFLYLIGFVSFWHVIPLIPALCIATSNLIVNLSKKISHATIQRVLPFAIISVIGVFGLLNLTTVVVLSNNSTYIHTVTFLSQYLANLDNNDIRITVIGNPYYLWIPEYVFHLNHDYVGYYDNIPILTKKTLAIFDSGLIERFKHHQAAWQLQKLMENSKLYTTSKITTFEGDGWNPNSVSLYLYDSNASTITRSFNKYENSTYNIRIQYPSNWEVDVFEDLEGTNVIHDVHFGSPFENDLDRFSDSLAVEITNLSANTKMEKHVQSIINYYNESFSSFNLLESDIGSAKLGGLPAYKLLYTLMYPRFGENETQIKIMQIGTIINDRSYDIRYYAEVNKYDDFLPIVQKMINSFVITKS